MTILENIRDELIDLNFPYIVMFLGTMQMTAFDSREVHKQVKEIMLEITRASPNSMVLFAGLVPCPIDHPRSRVRCENYSRSFDLSTEELCRTKGYNCNYISVYIEFLDQEGNIRKSTLNFQDDSSRNLCTEGSLASTSGFLSTKNEMTVQLPVVQGWR